MVGGRRVTDAATLDVMKMVVAGKLNVDLCGALVAAGARPVGLHGASSARRCAAMRAAAAGGRRAAGPTRSTSAWSATSPASTSSCSTLLAFAGYVPVLACLGADGRGQRAQHQRRHRRPTSSPARSTPPRLVLVTSAPGRAARRQRSVVAPAHADAWPRRKRAIADGTVTGGMIPKLEESMAVARPRAVGAIHIVGKLGPGDLVRASRASPAPSGRRYFRERRASTSKSAALSSASALMAAPTRRPGGR